MRPTDPAGLAAIARGEARAAADVATGVANLRTAAASAPEWTTTERSPSGGTRVEPTRQVLTGLLAHLERNQPTTKETHVRAS
jgi:hypothetical protein